MTFPPKKRPTHQLKVKEREGHGQTTIGVGWANKDGSISIRLSPCVVLSSRDEVFITLFPIDRENGDEDGR